MGEDGITFCNVSEDGVSNVMVIKRSDIAKCPQLILVAEHYRDDGSCKCLEDDDE